MDYDFSPFVWLQSVYFGAIRHGSVTTKLSYPDHHAARIFMNFLSTNMRRQEPDDDMPWSPFFILTTMISSRAHDGVRGLVYIGE